MTESRNSKSLDEETDKESPSDGYGNMSSMDRQESSQDREEIRTNNEGKFGSAVLQSVFVMVS